MDNVNLKKLAEELNLAISTVSRALRDSHEISQETKDRVKTLAAKWGFQPNPHASSLRQNKSKTIAVIVPEIQNNFFAQAMSGVEEVAQLKGYHVLIYLTHEDQRREKLNDERRLQIEHHAHQHARAERDERQRVMRAMESGDEPSCGHRHQRDEHRKHRAR